eukprot:CAMPEP_0202078836 /NCGR_PEP_ID=MMETSP0964-20121228/6148_1 /ASSEMBLY_ACC=CAM_ASM_000500 /TAXON_ID=4773 /ORGANISM="Schizochytrium aggregatum, Strain ATCC28209" /LENGTH=163 /DNA_ID=CAMNT_0048646149 /DNA_START=273 /DNA_END=761 /DNA_ORIENTATION=-
MVTAGPQQVGRRSRNDTAYVRHWAARQVHDRVSDQIGHGSPGGGQHRAGRARIPERGAKVEDGHVALAEQQPQDLVAAAACDDLASAKHLQHALEKRLRDRLGSDDHGPRARSDMWAQKAGVQGCCRARKAPDAGTDDALENDPRSVVARAELTGVLVVERQA